MIGKTLGHYRVGEQLGRGDMGEVYVADDLNLNRKVALKFLPEAFTGDPERMARFEREARCWRRSIIRTSPPYVRPLIRNQRRLSIGSKILKTGVHSRK
jgi:serine/threonine protein kinase